MFLNYKWEEEIPAEIGRVSEEERDRHRVDTSRVTVAYLLEELYSGKRRIEEYPLVRNGNNY